ncbi:MAG: TIGR00366 family protein [Firmicutes bacterium]|nr:TIGR00366 family protein [Bacillota bacterium]
MFRKFTNACVALVQKYLPDPFLFAVMLTIIVFAMGVLSTGQTPVDMISHWSDGFWSLLAFAMQMALVLVTGHTLAQAPVVKRGLRGLASIPKTPGWAIFAVTLVALIASWINWGFGLVIGALYAKELAKKVKGVDYRLLIASGYSGFVIWHAGFSGSIPLTVATATADLAEMTLGAVTEVIPTSQTIFAVFTVVPVLVLLVTMPFLMKAMHPKAENVVSVDPKLLEDDEAEIAVAREDMTPAEKLENSPLLSIIIGLMGIGFLVNYFSNNGFDLNLNIVNFLFLTAGIILHGTPRRFLTAVATAAKGTGGIIIQFPFYAGIMGMMTGANAEGLSLAAQMSNFFVNISNETTFPFFSFLSAGIVNFFVPSGGGQWAVQAPIMMPASVELGVDTAKTAMAIAWGDGWTNMIQPFWALPALGIAGLGAKDIMGYCLVNLFYVGIVVGVFLLIL